jgi:hypothetical protein
MQEGMFWNGEHDPAGEPGTPQTRPRQETSERSCGDGTVGNEPPRCVIEIVFSPEAPKSRWKRITARVPAFVTFVAALTTIDKGQHDKAIWVSGVFEWIWQMLG